MAFTFFPEGSPEWHQAWAMLAGELLLRGLGSGPDLAQWNEKYGEAWQYMGTWDGYHEFRHRAHPSNDERVCVRLAAGVLA